MATVISVNSGLRALICGAVLVNSVSTIAETGNEEPLPDIEFLEYLGMWETSDEEWLLLEDKDMAEPDKRSDPAPKGEESTEAEDED
jgi:hypothetical protein